MFYFYMLLTNIPILSMLHYKSIDEDVKHYRFKNQMIFQKQI
jgi:hypothetical protein